MGMAMPSAIPATAAEAVERSQALQVRAFSPSNQERPESKVESRPNSRVHGKAESRNAYGHGMRQSPNPQLAHLAPVRRSVTPASHQALPPHQLGDINHAPRLYTVNDNHNVAAAPDSHVGQDEPAPLQVRSMSKLELHDIAIPSRGGGWYSPTPTSSRQRSVPTTQRSRLNTDCSTGSVSNHGRRSPYPGGSVSRRSNSGLDGPMPSLTIRALSPPPTSTRARSPPLAAAAPPGPAVVPAVPSGVRGPISILNKMPSPRQPRRNSPRRNRLTPTPPAAVGEASAVAG